MTINSIHTVKIKELFNVSFSSRNDACILLRKALVNNAESQASCGKDARNDDRFLISESIPDST